MKPKMSDKVWITGVYTVTPLGNGFSEFGENLLAGKSGVDHIALMGAPDQRNYIAGCVNSIPTISLRDADSAQSLNRLEQLVLACTSSALEDAGLPNLLFEKRVGLVLGLGAEWLRTWEEDYFAGGNRVLDPEQDQQSIIQRVTQHHQIAGPSATIGAACASGNVAIAQARQWIELGWLDICLAGACDIVTSMAMGGFDKLRALSRSVDDPAAASRPFDRNRDGFVMSEGGAMFVLESATVAKQRGAQVYAEVAGYGASSDAFHIVAPSSDPQHAATAINQALSDAKLNPDEVDYVNAHATSTPVGDVSEANALRRAFGPAIEHIAVSSTKSMTGHLLSAAAAMEAVACLVALKHQAAPPTINLDDPDPECNLCHVPHHAREGTIHTVLSNSFGFGGSNTSLILRKVA